MAQLRTKAATENEYRENLFTSLDLLRYYLPLFPSTNLVQEDYRADTYIFDGKIYRQECIFDFANLKKEIFVEPTQCVGTTWLYHNDRSEGRSLPERLLTSLVLPTESAPPVPAERLGDKFICNDGNHRIYAAYLLGKKVKISVEGTHELVVH